MAARSPFFRLLHMLAFNELSFCMWNFSADLSSLRLCLPLTSLHVVNPAQFVFACDERRNDSFPLHVDSRSTCSYSPLQHRLFCSDMLMVKTSKFKENSSGVSLPQLLSEHSCVRDLIFHLCKKSQQQNWISYLYVLGVIRITRKLVHSLSKSNRAFHRNHSSMCWWLVNISVQHLQCSFYKQHFCDSCLNHFLPTSRATLPQWPRPLALTKLRQLLVTGGQESTNKHNSKDGRSN